MRDATIGIILSLIIGGGVLLGGIVWFKQANDRYTIQGTVLDKYIDNSGSESHYLFTIQLQDGNKKMLEVNRNILHGSNYNPDFVYSGVDEGKTYIFTCWGWDWQWWGVYWYPLVIIAEEV
jgi:hypothetical protein